jgi:hypothetical protein
VNYIVQVQPADFDSKELIRAVPTTRQRLLPLLAHPTGKGDIVARGHYACSEVERVGGGGIVEEVISKVYMDALLSEINTIRYGYIFMLSAI